MYRKLRKHLILLPAVLLLLAAPAMAEEPAATPTVTLSPTRIPDMVAVPEGHTRPILTATPRPTDAPLPEDPFMSNAIEIARRIELLAESDMFMLNWDYSNATQAQFDRVPRGDHTNPIRIFEMTADAMLEALKAVVPEGTTLPDLSRVELRRDLVDALPEMLMGDFEPEEVKMIRLLWRYKVFACDTVEGCGLMTLIYEDASPILLTWYADRGAVSIAACFMPDDALAACATAEEAAAWFAGKGLPAAAFKEVEWQ